MPQSYLDEFVEIEVEKREKVEEEQGVEEGMKRGREAVGDSGIVVEGSRRSEKMNIIADLKDPEHKSRYPYCGEWVGRLHGGTMYVYFKAGKLKALADINHVFKYCGHGLIENTGFLYQMLMDLRARGFNVVIVGKAYDDDLYAWYMGVEGI